MTAEADLAAHVSLLYLFYFPHLLLIRRADVWKFRQGLTLS